MRKLATPFLLLVGFAGVLPAQDGSSTTALSYTAKPDPPPDYSRERLVQMFHDIDIGANPRGLSPFDGLVIIQTRTFTLRFMPVLGSLLTLAAGNPSARFTPGGTLSVNPFALTHTGQQGKRARRIEGSSLFQVGNCRADRNFGFIAFPPSRRLPWSGCQKFLAEG